MRPPLSKEFLRGETRRRRAAARAGRAGTREHASTSALGAEAETLDPAARTRRARPAARRCATTRACSPPAPSRRRCRSRARPRSGCCTLRSARRRARVLRDRAAQAHSAIVDRLGLHRLRGRRLAGACAGCEVTLVTDEPVPQRAAARRGGRPAHRRLARGARRRRCGSARRSRRSATTRARARAATARGRPDPVAAGVEPCAGLAEAPGSSSSDGRDRRSTSSMRTARRRRLRGGRRRARPQRRRRPPAARSSTGARRSTWARSPGRTPPASEPQWDAAPGFWSTIGEHTLKYVAWGDGFDEARFVDHGERRLHRLVRPRRHDRRRAHPRARRGLRARPRADRARERRSP